MSFEINGRYEDQPVNQLGRKLTHRYRIREISVHTYCEKILNKCSYFDNLVEIRILKTKFTLQDVKKCKVQKAYEIKINLYF